MGGGCKEAKFTKRGKGVRKSRKKVEGKSERKGKIRSGKKRYPELACTSQLHYPQYGGVHHQI
jgi:hypothetical protein